MMPKLRGGYYRRKVVSHEPIEGTDRGRFYRMLHRLTLECGHQVVRGPFPRKCNFSVAECYECGPKPKPVEAEDVEGGVVTVYEIRIKDLMAKLSAEVDRLLAVDQHRESLRKENAELSAANEALRQRNGELDRLFELQHSRVQVADREWQQATGRTDVMPDLGRLVDWLREGRDKAHLRGGQEMLYRIRGSLENYGQQGGDVEVMRQVERLINEAVIRELKALATWVRDGTGYNRDDARDEIARAIENRIRDHEKLLELLRPPSPPGA